MELTEIEARLKAPFRPDEIEFRITAKTKDKTKGLAAAYIQARAVQKWLRSQQRKDGSDTAKQAPNGNRHRGKQQAVRPGILPRCR